MAQVIQVLPTEVANRIAAGEVIERPASIVKELIENAIDAGATEIAIELESGGVKRISVSDNGVGMSREDLALCVLPHATSKIRDVNDLFHVGTLGFRGEALPSIGSVADLSITTRQLGQEMGSRVEIISGVTRGPASMGAPYGTTVEVRNLFASVPARRKFLKQERSELANCVEMVTRLGLPRPEIGFSLRHGDRKVLELARCNDLRSRVRAVLGPAIDRELVVSEASDDRAQVLAYVARPSTVRSTSESQSFYLNGRYIRDRSLSFCLKDSFRGLIMPKDHPVGVIFMTIDPAEVDVNVHPTKIEVRFRDRDHLLNLVRRAIRPALLAESPAFQLKLKNPADDGQPPPRPSGGASPGSPAPRSQGGDPFQRELYPEGLEGHAMGPEPVTIAETVPKEATSPRGEFVPPLGVPDRPGKTASSARGSGRAACHGLRAEVSARGTENRPFVQLHASYVVTESPNGILLIDQHALHERRLFEELLSRYESAEIVVQRLLIPAVVDLPPRDHAALLEVLDELSRMGLLVADFGGTSLAVSGVPQVLSRIDPEDALRLAATVLGSEGAKLQKSEFVRSTFAELACRAAVKFNEPLKEPEIRALLNWWSAHPDLRNCPHGRPVAIEVTLSDLEQQFWRKR